jgi:hypothetical protein
MALTILDAPYNWTLRGQKLVYRIASDQTSQDGFRYGVRVRNMTTTKEYEFLVDISPSTTNLVFDLSPIIKMYNDDGYQFMHKYSFTTPFEEPQGGSWNRYRIYFSEWWLVDGVLTLGDELNPSGEELYVMNGYYQPSNGFKPDPNGTDVSTALSMEGDTFRAYTDRVYNTHSWFNNQSTYGSDDAIVTMIPVYNSDYGLLYINFDSELNQKISTTTISIYSGSTLLGTFTRDIISDGKIIGFGAYPMNLNDSTLPRTCTPAFYPNWSHYIIDFLRPDDSKGCMSYLFYNAELYGQYDCRYDRVRIAWVNSRSGWDYQNFIKKSETTNDLERKQYKKVLGKVDGSFDSWQRQYMDRQVIVNQTMSISSDWIQENEFLFLRSLFASNQVEMISTNILDGTLGNRMPISIVDTTYLERKERNGKKYNITIKIKYSQEYWT